LRPRLLPGLRLLELSAAESYKSVLDLSSRPRHGSPWEVIGAAQWSYVSVAAST